jgi:hypothetical protein
METAIKGNTAEAAVLKAFAEREFEVLVPFGTGQPYDLVVHLGSGVFLRVQCKTARLSRHQCVKFNARATDHGRGRIPYTGLADLFAAYFPPEESVYLVPVSEVTGHHVRLRLTPALNNQRRRVRFAQD